MDAANGTQYSQKHLEDLQRLKNFRLLDDDFCTKVFEILNVWNCYCVSY